MHSFNSFSVKCGVVGFAPDLGSGAELRWVQIPAYMTAKLFPILVLCVSSAFGQTLTLSDLSSTRVFRYAVDLEVDVPDPEVAGYGPVLQDSLIGCGGCPHTGIQLSFDFKCFW